MPQNFENKIRFFLSYNMKLKNFLDLPTYEQKLKPEESSIILYCPNKLPLQMSTQKCIHLRRQLIPVAVKLVK